MTRWLVVGANGMLGQDVAAAARSHGIDVVTMDYPDIDITDYNSVARAMGLAAEELPPDLLPTDTAASDLVPDPDLAPEVEELPFADGLGVLEPFDVVVNCAAWTAVDDAEDNEAAAFAVNAVGAANLARACSLCDAKLVQISTDYVFDGTAETPYSAGAVMAPQSAYGRTKAAGEWAVAANTDDYLIVRTAWLYGASGHNFPKTMARLAATRPELTVVDDQVGPPTWTKDLAELIIDLVASDAPSGIYHGTSSGQTSWHGFASAVMKSLGNDVTVRPVTSAEFPAKATRPAYSVLGHDELDRIGVAPIGHWENRWLVAAPAVLELEQP